MPGTLVHQVQDLDRRVVIVYHVALGRLPNEFFKGRLDSFGLGVNDVPLRRSRHGNAKIRLQSFHAIERHPFSVFQQGNHAPSRRVVLLLLALGWLAERTRKSTATRLGMGTFTRERQSLSPWKRRAIFTKWCVTWSEMPCGQEKVSGTVGLDKIR